MTHLFILLDGGWSAVGAIGSLAAALVAIPYTIFTFKLLKENKKISDTNNKLAEFQIYNEISKLLTTEEVKKLIVSCQSNTLVLDSTTKPLIKHTLLNPLEDLAKFHEDGLISLNSISSGFGSMILCIGNNEKINDLVLMERTTFSTVYSGFENLYDKMYEECTEQEKKGLKAKFITK